MRYGITHLSIVPLRLEPSDTSEMVSQVLYCDYFKVLEQRKKWSKIRLTYDKYEGWIDNKQFLELPEATYKNLAKENLKVSSDLVEYISNEKGQLSLIPIGANINGISILQHQFDGEYSTGAHKKEEIIKTAFLYLNSPYLWGGKPLSELTVVVLPKWFIKLMDIKF